MSKEQREHPIPDSVYDEALRVACKQAEILNPLYVQRIVAAFASVIEEHMDLQKHLLSVEKEVGGIPIQYTTEDCWKWQHKK